MSDELPRATRKALGKLLDACGLDNEFTGGESSHPPDDLEHSLRPVVREEQVCKARLA